jgi:hypothetical protein
LGQQRQEQGAATPQLDELEHERQEDAEQQQEEAANHLDEDEGAVQVPEEAQAEPPVAEVEDENQTNEPVIF